MVLTFQEGEKFRNQMLHEYDHEIELVCINQEVRNLSLKQVKKELQKSIELIEKYPGKTIIRESEAHEKDSAYYEVSVFCNKDQLKEITDELNEMGYLIDIIHDLK